MKHTPGPWKTDPRWGSKVFGTYSHYITPTKAERRDFVLAEVAGHTQAGDAMANARLIAAAPEMLEALRGVMECVPYVSGADPMVPALLEMLRNVRAAIAKATE